ncbi:hypothetical protein QRX50_32195 [Amycolatopsis carbonis]|uniref:Uncharacterized protein n=1 Tax=Amycolatopsis carbonis TaxID=715471 RepID=A0A9Y2IBU4_9PSEU|nr:hypothetical protein [Amycolatopsis sp. 2-15]WIX76116.1 hypothetical protein QRX50_32195 [Amycolatopsis sp. 2-15]
MKTVSAVPAQVARRVEVVAFARFGDPGGAWVCHTPRSPSPAGLDEYGTIGAPAAPSRRSTVDIPPGSRWSTPDSRRAGEHELPTHTTRSR